jgi:hypothetical protein
MGSNAPDVEPNYADCQSGEEATMDPIADVNPLCPCWIVMNDGSRHRCDLPVGLIGNHADLTYKFMSGTDEQAVAWVEIAAFVNIADTARRVAVR